MNNPIDGAKRNINIFTQKLDQSNQRLSTGQRINKASDDAASLAIALQLAADTSQLNVARRNISDGVSLNEIRDSVYTSLGNIGERQAELAAQAANGTLNDTQREVLNQEFTQLTEEANRIIQATTFNGQQVVGQTVNIQVGTDSSANSQIRLVDPNVAETAAALSPLSINTQGNAQSALSQVQTFLQSVSTSRGELGAQTSRLESAGNSAQNRAIANQEAESRIRSADIAEEVSNRVAAQIGRDSATAVFAQANRLNAGIVQRLLA